MNVAAEKEINRVPSIVRTAALSAAFPRAEAVLEPYRNLHMEPINFINRWIDQNSVMPYMVIHHNQMEKATMFTEAQTQIADLFGTHNPVKPVRTVTTKPDGLVVAITNFGADITNADKRKIFLQIPYKNSLGVSFKTAKNAPLNSLSINPVETFGSESGIVGPFIPKDRASNISAWIILDDPTVSDEDSVHVALSHEDTLVLRKKDFQALLKAYEDAALGPQFFRHIKAEE